MEASDDAIIWKTLDGIIVGWNKGAERLYGYSADEVIGKPISILVLPDRTNELRGIMDRLRRGDSIVHYETVRQEGRDGLALQSLVEKVCTALRPLAEQKHLELKATVPEGELMVNTERRALSQILFNLINNAIKFT
jgi:signal transduction histidine kinase